MSNQVTDFLTDAHGDQSKSKHGIMIALIVGVVVLVLIVVFRNLAANAASGTTTTTGTSGSGTTTTTGTDTSSLAYQQGLADIQNATATTQEALQEKLNASTLANSESLATFNSKLQQTNTMNSINDLIYSEKAQNQELNAETNANVTSAGNALTNWYNTLTGTKVSNGQTLLQVLGGWGGSRQNATTNAVESNIFNTAFGGNGTATPSGSTTAASGTVLNTFWQNLGTKNVQAS